MTLAERMGIETVDRSRWVEKSRIVPHVSHLLRAMQVPQNEKMYRSFERDAGNYTKSYSAWEMVRKFYGKRVTGNVFEVKTQQQLPSTGFEGYYVGLGMTPQKIVTDLANRGADILRTIKNTSYSGEVVQNALTIIDGKNGLDIQNVWVKADDVFRTFLSNMKNLMQNQPKEIRNLNESFRQGTYDSLFGAPDMSFDIGYESYAHTIWFPKNPELTGPDSQITLEKTHGDIVFSQTQNALPQTTVEFTQDQLEGYFIVAERIGIVGEPMMRSCINNIITGVYHKDPTPTF